MSKSTIASEAFKNIMVKELGGGTVPATSLWEAKRTVILLVRRWGCALCHHQTQLLMDVMPKLEEQGVSIVAVGNGSEAFAEKYKTSLKFGGRVFVDEESKMFKALDFKRWSNWKLAGWLFSWSKISHFKSLGKKYPGSDMEGDGHQTGGVLLAGPGDTAVDILFREYDGMEQSEEAKRFLSGDELMKAVAKGLAAG